MGIATLQWEEIWSKGTISVTRADGTLLGEVPFLALTQLRLNLLKNEASPDRCPTFTPDKTPKPDEGDVTAPPPTAIPAYDSFDNNCVDGKLWNQFADGSPHQDLLFLPSPDGACWNLEEWGLTEQEGRLDFTFTNTATDDVMSYYLVEILEQPRVTAVEIELTIDSVGNQGDGVGLFTRLNDDERTWVYYRLWFGGKPQIDQGDVIYEAGGKWVEGQSVISLPAMVTLKLVWNGHEMKFYLDDEPILEPVLFPGFSDTFGIYWVTQPDSFLQGHIDEVRVSQE